MTLPAGGRLAVERLVALRPARAQDAPLSDILGVFVGNPDPTKASEPHDRWNVGDRWLRCRAESSVPAVVRLEVDATWAPDSMALLYVQLSTRGASACWD